MNNFQWNNTTNVIGWFGTCVTSTATLPVAKASPVVELLVGTLSGNKT